MSNSDGQQGIEEQEAVIRHSDSGTPTQAVSSKGRYWWSTRRFCMSLLLSVLLAIGVFVFFVVSFGHFKQPNLVYNDLHYDMQVLPNGDLRVKQKVDIKLRARKDTNGGDKTWRRLYQQYRLDSSDLTGISDISVRDLTQGTEYQPTTALSPDIARNFIDWNRVRANHWYAAIVEQYPAQYSDDYIDYEYDPATPKSSTDESSPAGCAPDEQSCLLEIGWNIPETVEADSRVFEIEMTMHGVTTAYNDVSNFEWEPIGGQNETLIRRVSGVIRLPKNTNRENSKAWLHFNGPSNNWRDADGTLHFEAGPVQPEQHLDVNVYMDKSLTPNVARVNPHEAKDGIEASERSDELRSRMENLAKAREKMQTFIVLSVITIVFAIVLIISAFSSYNKSRYHGDAVYWREIPGITPAATAVLSEVLFAGMGQSQSRQMAATILSLANKRAIAIYPGPASLYQDCDPSHMGTSDLGQILRKQKDVKDVDESSEKTSTIVILPLAHADNGSLDVSRSEQAALDMLLAVSGKLESSTFDLIQVKETFKDDASSVKLKQSFDDAVASESGFLVLRHASLRVVISILAVIVAFGLVIHASHKGLLLVGCVLAAVVIACVVFCLSYGSSDVLTVDGQEQAGKIIGLHQYLTDFSSFTDRGVTDLTLWGSYLVYAAAMGISKKAMEQLAQAYPQVTDSSWLDSNTSYPLIYMSYRPYGFEGGWQDLGSGGFESSQQVFISDFSDIGSELASSCFEIETAISASGISSDSDGSFSGGGFDGSFGGSGGGSFGGD
ncbi:DUF2207 domain-containing protein [Bombiscardovia coagulans]|uniref:DUF2207 domain-containing protein n=1 Tax=Bombiscardovia coagulans TaxID=686666 RepID=A0A261EU34_9BIFI|nr:DUF2207 domain-containing protein [Bombiscardovia coagulans]OZG50371.1 hypothetical protein BOCO_0888 [Bombiscardovia coagulans]